MRPHRPSLALFLLACTPLLAQTKPAIDPAKASAAFAEARTLSDHEGGKLWGMPLYGPTLFVVPATHEVVANEADTEGVLHKQGEVFTGILPKNMAIANTAVNWSGKRWTMVMWPLPAFSQPRQRLLAHELFHRIQPDLHIPLANPDNSQLDTLDGRLYLQLEWRALAAALVTSGPAQTEAVHDAIAFRHHRHHEFVGSVIPERSLELNEGLAEYTGLAASAPDVPSAHWRAVARLTTPDDGTFVRSFAYASGPAYGLLLDQRLPGWRTKITATSDLGGLLATTAPPLTDEPIDQIAQRYGGAALRLIETERETQSNAEKQKYRTALIDGPTVHLPGSDKISVSFDPREIVPLGEPGNVYPTIHISDAWGTLEVEGGALVSRDFKNISIPAPTTTTSPHLEGPGWKLDLTPGWKLTPSTKAGSYEARHP